jgi:hypothetical protein
MRSPWDLTWEEAAAVISTALGKSVRYAEVSNDQARAGLESAGVPPFLAAIVVELYTALGDGRMDPEEPRTPDTTTPTTLAAFARDVLAPIVSPAHVGMRRL